MSSLGVFGACGLLICCSEHHRATPDQARQAPVASELALPALHAPRLGALPLRYGPLEPLLPAALRVVPVPRPSARSLPLPEADVPERFRAFAGAAEQARLDQGIAGLAVAIVEGGQVTFARGFGSKDPERLDPVEPTTLFRIASNTKPMTAVALLRGVERGELELDAALVDYLPTFVLSRTPESVPQITLRQLLAHASGLSDTLDVNVPAEEKTDAALSEFLLGRYRDIGAVMARPGEIFSYSNAGFSLLGLVAETLRHTPYRQLMQEEVFAPLHMDRTYLLPSEVLDDGDFALGSCPAAEPECGGFGIGPIIAPADYDNAWGRPPAGAWSSVLDLARFARFLVHGDARVLSDELRAVMASPQISTRYAGDELSYGLGLELASGFALDDPESQTASFYNSKVISHDGLLPGFRSTVQCLPSADFCFIALANATEVSFSILSQAAFRLSALPAQALRPQLDPDPERFAAYTGTYFDPLSNGVLRVSADVTGGLQLDFLLLDAFQIPYAHQLTPTLVDNFVFDLGGGPQALTFLAGPTGSYDYLRIFDRDVAARVADTAAAEP